MTDNGNSTTDRPGFEVDMHWLQIVRLMDSLQRRATTLSVDTTLGLLLVELAALREHLSNGGAEPTLWGPVGPQRQAISGQSPISGPGVPDFVPSERDN